MLKAWPMKLNASHSMLLKALLWVALFMRDVCIMDLECNRTKSKQNIGTLGLVPLISMLLLDCKMNPRTVISKEGFLQTYLLL